MQLPASGHVHLWVQSEPHTLSTAEQQHIVAWLNDEERQRWQRFKFSGDRQRFLQARALVRSVLAGCLQQAPASLKFTCNQYGKPQLQQEPLPLRFNLSHTHGLLVLAVSVDAEVGVDVESVSREVEPLALAERFFAHAESALIEAQTADLQRDCFFRLWTLKEAYVKARGLGLQLGLDSFAFQFDTAGLPSLVKADASTDPSQWSFIQLQHAEHYRIALAVQSPGLSSAQVTLLTPTF